MQNKKEIKSQSKKVLAYLKKGYRITSLSGLTKFGIISLPKRICQIIAMGYKIEKKRIAVINRFGDRIYVMRYRLNN